jgi:pyrroloquinoline quinone biosynthesis protein D
MSAREIPRSACPRLSAHARLQWDAVRERQVLLMPESVLALNATGYAIVALCDGQRSVTDIIALLSEQYSRPVEQDVLTFLNRLLNKRLLDIADG